MMRRRSRYNENGDFRRGRRSGNESLSQRLRKSIRGKLRPSIFTVSIHLIKYFSNSIHLIKPHRSVFTVSIHLSKLQTSIFPVVSLCSNHVYLFSLSSFTSRVKQHLSISTCTIHLVKPKRQITFQVGYNL